MNYQQELASLTTVKELFDFRDKMIAIKIENAVKHHELLLRLTMAQLNSTNREFATKRDNADFLKTRVEEQIRWLGKKGIFLNEIGTEALPKIDKSDLQPFS